jgi:hypothetical protein
MKEIILTQGKTALVDDEDFEELYKYKWHADKHGSIYYAVRSININYKIKHILMHRQIFGITDKKIFIDHIDHNSLNNQKSNLRICTNQQNQRNSLKQKNTTSIYKGVSLNKKSNKWHSIIIFNNKSIYLGSYINEIDAAKAYDVAAIKYFGEFANINFVYA